MKIYINSAKENWVVDRFIDEWNKFNFKQSKNFRFGDKIVWLIAPWTWRKIPKKYLIKNKVVCTIHHIDEDKFKSNEEIEFKDRDKFVDYYHVISNKTFDQVIKLTDKPVHKIPFWVNQNLWFEIKNKEQLREKYSVDINSYLVGSFQRDTEGYDLVSPKLSKGPDRFLEIVEYLNTKNENLQIILTGKRRNYILDELSRREINYKYFEMTSFQNLNELYNILDLYIVSSRYEGGPQSILETAMTRTPIISTDVGIASEILDKKSIFNMDNYKDAIPNTDISYQNAKRYLIPEGFKEFNKLFREIYES
tara:strand:- start:989 stop:1912 length:924 start_codon:yes stop_codon:yes gene_type:complete